ncbi:hypothetical protein BX589_101275 [Paraburkholderia fungorum]|jgi:hypothetical protein|uniref:hypothetical protein n=1 Tax=Paraburkholderia fungorum TaxID=134537 RepID=UPI000D04A5C9|nr:hypothetical protein [Paraburkholderia fungorum]PRZ56625.1 hypothetical protein BX589_101275 [Paraburkholderia fungorum]
MKERPILFSGAMVRALLDGSKTQTRRVMKKQPYISHTNPPQFSDVEVGDLFICPDCFPTTPVRGSVIAECKSIGTYHCMGQREFAEKHSPYGVPGDRLWVRETFQGPMWEEGTWDPDTDYHKPEFCEYRADGGPMPDYVDFEDNLHQGWKPSIHMPRWASRITLEVTGVRVERLQDISEDDARAEGARECDPVSGREVILAGASQRGSFVLHYRDIWDSFNAARGYGWNMNPWVWVIEFRRLT